MWKILSHVFLIYSFSFAITGIHMLAVALSVGFFVILVVAKVPKASQSDAEEVLQAHKTCIIAHRGAGHDAPENTLAAIREVRVCYFTNSTQFAVPNQQILVISL